MKKTILLLSVIVLATALYFLFIKDKKTQTQENPNKQYRNLQTNISFTYPKILNASTTDGIVALRHQIPYKNTGACDMMGDDKTYDYLTDFEMSVQKVETGLTETVKKFSPYIPQENFVNEELIASPGFIDPITIGKLSGFAIYEGVEGCGQITYYFPISKDETLIVTNTAIQALNKSVRSEENINKILAVPGVISEEKNEQIFTDIVKSISY